MHRLRPWKRSGLGLASVLFCFFLAGSCLAANQLQLAPLKRQVVQVQPQIKTLKFKSAVRFVPSKDIQASGGKGPSPQQHDVLVGSSLDETLFEEGCALSRWVYEDQNPASGLFYFTPNRFRLAWSRQGGYGLSFQYNTKEDASDKTAVLMTATLVSNYNLADRAIVEALVKSSRTGKPFKELKPLPVYDMQVSLDALSVGLAIPPEQITVTPVNNIGGEIRVTVAMSETNIEELLAALETAQGLGGYLSFPLEEGESPKVVSVPIHLSLCDFAPTDMKKWQRGDPFENMSDFPVRLRRLVALASVQGKIKSYDYRLGDTVIAPRKSVPIKASAIRTDPAVLKYFFDTELLCGDCPECMAKVSAGLRRATGQAKVEQLEFTAIPNVFSEYDLFEIIVQVESPYFSPTASGVMKKEIKLTAENNVAGELSLYLTEAGRGKRSSGPLLRYRIAVVTTSGERLEGAEWIESEYVTGNYIGSKQLAPLFGAQPTTAPATPAGGGLY